MFTIVSFVEIIAYLWVRSNPLQFAAVTLSALTWHRIRTFHPSPTSWAPSSPPPPWCPIWQIKHCKNLVFHANMPSSSLSRLHSFPSDFLAELPVPPSFPSSRRLRRSLTSCLPRCSLCRCRRFGSSSLVGFSFNVLPSLPQLKSEVTAVVRRHCAVLHGPIQ